MIRQIFNQLRNMPIHPVLLEGNHSTGIIPAIKKKILLRLRKDETVYYANLAAPEKTFLKELVRTLPKSLPVNTFPLL